MSIRGMRSSKIPQMMRTGPQNTLPFSSTVYTFVDNSLEREEEIDAGNYSVFQPFFSPKGVTGEAIYVEGNDILNKFIKINGKMNTLKYGPMGTWALAAVESGFNLGYVNMRTSDSTYPNAYVALVLDRVYNKKANSDEDDPANPKKQDIFWYKNTDTSDPDKKGYYFGFSKDEIKEQLKSITVTEDDIKTAKVQLYEFGFDACHLTGLTLEGSFEGELDKENDGTKINLYGGKNVAGVKKPLVLTSEIDNHINSNPDATRKQAYREVLKNLADVKSLQYPIFGLCYRGAGTYGNRFYANIYAKTDRLDNRYPYYTCTIRENDVTEEHSFDFTPFYYSIGQTFNYNFRDRAINTCKVPFTITNQVQTFEAYMISRRISNELEGVVAKSMEILKKKVVDAMTAVDTNLQADVDGPTATPLSKKNFELFLKGYDDVTNKFKRPVVTNPNVDETPLSNWNITRLVDKVRNTSTGEWIITTKPTPGLTLLSCPEKVQFYGGSFGQLQDVLDDGDFDMDEVINYKVPGTPEIKKGYKVWNEMLKDVFEGRVDTAIYDAALIKDCIVFGDDYSNELQNIIAELVRYNETAIHHTRTRPDWTFIRTPQNRIRTASEALNEWATYFDTDVKNYNMHPCIGSWMFNDPTTGGQSRFNSWYEYLGKGGSLYAYLTSYTENSFATGDYSLMLNASPGTGFCIPEDDDIKTKLVNQCIMFYTLRSTGYYALGEDLGYLPKFISNMKNVGSCIHFNRISNIAINFARDRQITNPTRENLDKMKKQLDKLITIPSRHFGGRVITTAEVSNLEVESKHPVVLFKISTTGHTYSRHNRVEHIMNKSDTKVTE